MAYVTIKGSPLHRGKTINLSTTRLDLICLYCRIAGNEQREPTGKEKVIIEQFWEIIHF
jgi:hypothetical protein